MNLCSKSASVGTSLRGFGAPWMSSSRSRASPHRWAAVLDVSEIFCRSRRSVPSGRWTRTSTSQPPRRYGRTFTLIAAHSFGDGVRLWRSQSSRSELRIKIRRPILVTPGSWPRSIIAQIALRVVRSRSAVSSAVRYMGSVSSVIVDRRALSAAHAEPGRPWGGVGRLCLIRGGIGRRPVRAIACSRALSATGVGLAGDLPVAIQRINRARRLGPFIRNRDGRVFYEILNSPG